MEISYLHTCHTCHTPMVRIHIIPYHTKMTFDVSFFAININKTSIKYLWVVSPSKYGGYYCCANLKIKCLGRPFRDQQWWTHHEDFADSIAKYCYTQSLLSPTFLQVSHHCHSYQKWCFDVFLMTTFWTNSWLQTRSARSPDWIRSRQPRDPRQRADRKTEPHDFLPSLSPPWTVIFTLGTWGHCGWLRHHHQLGNYSFQQAQIACLVANHPIVRRATMVEKCWNLIFVYIYNITARRLVLPGDLQGRSPHVDLDLDLDDMKISYMLDPISI